MGPFPSPVIHSARLDLRTFGPSDVGLVRAHLAAGWEPEALPPGAPSDPDEVTGWLSDGVHWPQREGVGVHLMMLDRSAVASVRVAEKAGLHREGTLRRAGLEEDGLHDLAVFSLLDDEL
jgi:hypothetical protein